MDDARIILIEKKIESVRVKILLKQCKDLFSLNIIPLKLLNADSPSTELFKSIIIVSELEYIEDAKHLFEVTKTLLPDNAIFVSTKWLSDSIRAKQINLPSESYHLQAKNAKATEQDDEVEAETQQQPENICQMRCPVDHQNSLFTDALSVLARSAEHWHGVTKEPQYYAKALAFDRAAACLKSLDRRVTSMAQVAGFRRYLGDHALKVIAELVDTGACAEVDNVLASELYQSMVKLTAVYGVGDSLAYKWFQRGVREPGDALKRMLEAEQRGQRDADFVGSDYGRLQVGLAFHADLAQHPMTLAEAQRWRDSVAVLLARLRGPGFRVILAGGFARGKSCGHDCDLLVTHDADDDGAVAGAVADVARALVSAGRVLHADYHRAVGGGNGGGARLKSTFDNFEKWMAVVREEAEEPDSQAPPAAKRPRTTLGSPSHCAFACLADAMSMAQPGGGRNWLARRVDLIGVPRSQLPYARLGWTGNRLFNRDLRLLAQNKFGLRLTSHGLFDPATNSSLPASSDEEIFRHLGLEYIPPQFRNC